MFLAAGALLGALSIGTLQPSGLTQTLAPGQPFATSFPTWYDLAQNGVTVPTVFVSGVAFDVGVKLDRGPARQGETIDLAHEPWKDPAPDQRYGPLWRDLIKLLAKMVADERRGDVQAELADFDDYRRGAAPEVRAFLDGGHETLGWQLEQLKHDDPAAAFRAGSALEGSVENAIQISALRIEALALTHQGRRLDALLHNLDSRVPRSYARIAERDSRNLKPFAAYDLTGVYQAIADIDSGKADAVRARLPALLAANFPKVGLFPLRLPGDFDVNDDRQLRGLFESVMARGFDPVWLQAVVADAPNSPITLVEEAYDGRDAPARPEYGKRFFDLLRRARARCHDDRAKWLDSEIAREH